jgi:hypothetical protein
MEDEDFGLALSHENGWMSDELNSIISGTGTEVEKTNKIYSYIRDNFKSTSDDSKYAHSSLKDVFKKRAGNVAEVNLTAMLRKAVSGLIR